MARTGEELTNPATGQRIVFRRTAADTDGEVLELESAWRPGGPRPPAHLHPHQDEHFEVEAGELSVQVDGTERVLRAGDTLDVPRGTVHEMWNAGSEEARATWQTRPALQSESMMESLWRLAEDGKVNAKGLPGILQLTVIAHAHSDEFRLAKPAWPLQRVVLALLAAVGRLRGYRPTYPA